jgi:hypothetical protein
MLELEADHRRHAEIENAIRDLKYGMALNHLPSGRFAANGAWLAIQVMTHNLPRWTARLELGAGVVTTKALRRRLFGPSRRRQSVISRRHRGPRGVRGHRQGHDVPTGPHQSGSWSVSVDPG